MGKQPVPSMELKPQLVFCSLELGDWRYISDRRWADNAGRLLNPPLHLHTVHSVLRLVRIDLVRSRTACPGLDPIAWTRTSGKNLLREHDGLPVLGPAVRNPASAYVSPANHRSDAVQRLVPASVCRLQPSHRDERGQRFALDHGRPHSFYRKPHRPWRHWRHPDDCDQWRNDCGSGGIGVDILRRKRLGRRATGFIWRAAISSVRWFRCSQSRERSRRPRFGWCRAGTELGWRRRDWRFKTTHTSKFRWSQRNDVFCQWGSIHWRNAFRATEPQRFAVRCREISQWLQRPQPCRFRGLASRPRDWQNHALGRDGCRTMKTPQSRNDAPEIASFTRYYEHDGMLRAYANRSMFLAILFAVIALSSLGFAIYVRIQPPTVIRVDKDGNAVVVGGGARQDRTSQMAMVLSAQAAGADATASEGVAPTELEGKAVVRRFLEHYLSYTPDSAPRNHAESLNMMTNNLRTFTLNKLRDDDTVGKIQEDHIISDLRIRSIERTRNGPWDYVVFGVKEVHKVKSGAEVTDRIVGQYNIRLVEERRSEFNPSGLLVAEYSEKQMVGERDNGLEQKSELDK